MAPAPQPPSLPEPSGRDWAAGLNWPPTETPPDGRSTGGRRRKPDPLDSEVSLDHLQGGLDHLQPNGTPAPPAPREGGRRRRYDPDDETTDEVRPFRGDSSRTQFNPLAPAAPAWSPTVGSEPQTRNPRPAFDVPQAAAAPPMSPPAPPMSPPAPPMPPAAAPMSPGAPPMSRSARRHAEAQRQPLPGPPADRRGGVDHGAANGLPAWSARRRPDAEPSARGDQMGARGDQMSARADQAAVPTAAWSSSLADDDQQLLSGQSVAGDLLRDAQSRDDQRADRNSRNGGKRRGRAVPEPEPDDHLTDFYEPLDDDEYDDYDDEPRPSMAGRLSTLTAKAGTIGRKAGAKGRTATRGSRAAAPARSRAKGRSEEDENRRQWAVIAGQSVGAAVAGMLLFKGFERMWEMQPWVALALAMIVILGLVALVRVLRRTDDIFSTVIAVVVGVFVTLGPLAFLLSTN
ncbi:hypothetical protein [Nocardia sp. CDC160]|uniref:hypothetical protein n=1 Tax=Nocardia sp. CDC160 TaxID=3112166 RepID=UPI002DB977E8|nr:hypothetical protein [Nocardia sp. CDC160]MEC3919603.1 hypothetical protein [Nocardia sp. CDC160]